MAPTRTVPSGRRRPPGVLQREDVLRHRRQDQLVVAAQLLAARRGSRGPRRHRGVAGGGATRQWNKSKVKAIRKELKKHAKNIV